MTPTTKELFIKNKELRDKWAAWAKNDDFGIILAYAKSSLIESRKCTTEMLAGAMAFQDILLNLGDEEDLPSQPVRSGFKHTFPGSETQTQ